MNYQETAARILEKVGGPGNIAAMEHCSTRLRLTTVDNAKVDVAGLKEVPGVLGVVTTGQTQIIIGNEVVEVFDALQKLAGPVTGSAVATGGTKQKWGAVFLDFLVGVFQPLVPAIAGAGVLKSLMILLSTFGWISSKDPTYIGLVAISDATFYFLPLMVAVTTATKLKVNRLVALAGVGVLLLPSLNKLITDPAAPFTMFGLTVPNVPYSGQVFPAILSVLLLAVVERFMTRVSPKPVRIFLVPMVALLVTVPATLLFLGPLGYNMGQAFTAAILFVYATVGWIAVPLVAAALPFMVSIGMHKALLPYALSTFAETGKETLYLPASLAHNIAEAGAMFGVALRTRNTEIRSTAISAGVSALCGITEPALYGITIQHKRALLSVIAGALAGGTYAGLMMLQSFVIVGPGLPSLSMFVDAANPMNMVHALITTAISFLVAGLTAAATWKDALEHVPADTEETFPDQAVATPAGTRYAGADLLAPLSGQVIPLSEVQDAVFAGGVLGQGVAIQPTSGEVCAPADGVVATVFNTHHAIAITTDSGAEVLIHVGLDTVKLGGKHFETLVAKGERVTAGQLLIRADLGAIRAAGYDTTTPVVVLNSQKFDVTSLGASQVAAGDALIAVDEKVLVS